MILLKIRVGKIGRQEKEREKEGKRGEKDDEGINGEKAEKEREKEGNGEEKVGKRGKRRGKGRYPHFVGITFYKGKCALLIYVNELKKILHNRGCNDQLYL